MTDHEREPIILMLRDLRGELLEEVRQSREHLGNAIGETRGEVRSLGQALEHHVAMDNLRFSGVEQRFVGVESDHRELKGRVDEVDKTGRQDAVTAAEAKALTVHLKDGEQRLHGWRQKLTLFALTLICALLGFALRGLLGI